MENTVYVPILKWKTGEQEALINLRPEQKSSITPLIEIVDEDKLPNLLNDLKISFSYPVYLDTKYIDGDNREILKFLVNEANDNNTPIYPVLYYDDFPDTANDLIDISNRFSVKIPVPEDIEGESYSKIFEDLSSWCSEKHVTIDIILDLSLIKEDNKNILYAELKNVINNYLSKSHPFDNIIIAMTSFPEELSSIAAGEDIKVRRHEKFIFKKLKNEFNNHKIIYSDYGVTRFTDTEIDFSKLRHGVLPKGRYTTSDNYWILKGKKNRKTGQWIRNHRSIAEDIYKSDYYYGKDFSYGDNLIKLIALKIDNKGPGNNQEWVTIAANHHLSVLIEELSNHDF